MSKQANNNDLAALILNDSSLGELCRRFGVDPVTKAERTRLISLGLVESRQDNIARGGQVFLLTPMGRLASRVGRLAEVLA